METLLASLWCVDTGGGTAFDVMHEKSIVIVQTRDLFYFYAHDRSWVIWRGESIADLRAVKQKDESPQRLRRQTACRFGLS